MRMPISYSFNCFNHSTYYGLPPSLPAQIAAAAAAGYDHVGLDVPSLLAHEQAGTSPGEIREHLERAGISCFELVPLSLSADPSAVAASLATVRRLASAVGAQHVLATVRSEPDHVVAEQLRRVAGVLGDAWLRVSLEFMPSTPLRSLGTALDLIDRAGVPEVGVVLDVWHFALGAPAWELLEAMSMASIGFVQLDDALASADGRSLHDCMEERLLPGDGELPLAQILGPLLRRGYGGVVSVEVLSADWRRRPLDDFARATFDSSVAMVEASRDAGWFTR